jgi:CCR4-NOT transcription complex subunit 2
MYIFFDVNNWRRERKEIILNYDDLDTRPTLLQGTGAGGAGAAGAAGAANGHAAAGAFSAMGGLSVDGGAFGGVGSG